MNPRFTRSRIAAAALAAAGTLALGIGMAEAAAGGGRSFGSRGGKTFNSAPATPTAPKSSDTIQRSTTQPGQIAPGAAARPGAAGSAVAGQTARSGFGSLLMGGLLGAGLFGLLSGAGLFSGLSGLAGILGLVLQFALIAGIVWLGLAFWRSRSQPAAASANAGLQRAALDPNAGRPPMGGGSGAMGGGQPAGPGMTPLSIGPQDFQTFERLLGEIQGAFGRSDVPAIRMRATPEMAGYLSEDIAAITDRGHRNEISDVKLLQGDLSEAWSEADADYATVAMRFSMVDATVDASGRVVDGSRTEPREVTEVWTFRRPRGASAGGWKLSAIQQVQ